MTVVDQWTGRHARALQAAMRLTNEAFAEHLGVSPRTVAKWRERPEMIPSPQLQEALDTSLKLAAADTKLRFTSNLGTANDEQLRLDESVISQLNAAVGDLARVLARITQIETATEKDRASSEAPAPLDEIQA
jgi:transcriptional regulator with XRE-family HTH domain